jgi:hypothetical protein
MVKTNMQMSFNALEQGPSRIISEFKKEFDILLRYMRSAGNPEMDGESLAISFFGETISSPTWFHGAIPYQW